MGIALGFRLGVAVVLGGIAVGCDVDVEDVEVEEGAFDAAVLRKAVNGKKLFEDETFGGNGRTCQTCHTKATGTLSPAQVQEAFADDPSGPLFRAIDSDDGTGASYERLLTDATVLVSIPLPPGWSLADDPQATEVLLPRGIPTTMNVPSLDDLFMVDARFDTLEEQALGAIDSHAEPGRQPTQAELEAIADFQQTNQFFNDNRLKHWANGGPPPELPQGTTESEIRGRVWFVPGPQGVCAFCHAGPMLDETSEFLPTPPLPAGTRIFTAFVSELNPGNRPVRTFLVEDGDGEPTVVETPDPGRALITGDLADLNLFRTPTLWGAKHTAPYFHDNSAPDLQAMVDHYSDYFVLAGLPALTEQEKQDIIAYMNLL
jgi:cytochrome c peroxidase